MKTAKSRGIVLLALAALTGGHAAVGQNYALDPRDANFRERLATLEETLPPVIGPDHPGLAGNVSGFETGVTVKVGAIYHLFVGEMFGRPHLDLRIAHWRSKDAVHWDRDKTVIASDPRRSATNPMSETWVQAIIYDETKGRWSLFYVAYRGGNSQRGEAQNMDYEGMIRRADAATPGMSGIDGNFVDAGIVMKPDAHSTRWEGQQGVDSFFPYKVGKKWVTLHGSHNHIPPSPWLVGVAQADSLDSTRWTRIRSEQPSPIESLFIENPIVLRLPNGHFMAVYDVNNYPNQADVAPSPANSIGYSVSEDGVHWHQGRALVVQSRPAGRWSADVRTPMGLVPEPDGTYTLLYSAKMVDRPFWAIGRVRVRLSLD
jgi:hypothetical protein